MMVFLLSIVCFLLLLLVFAGFWIVEDNREAGYWKKIAKAESRNRVLGDMIARHRVNLDDEALWSGYREWKKTQE